MGEGEEGTPLAECGAFAVGVEGGVEGEEIVLE